MSKNDIKIFNRIHLRRENKSKSLKLDKSFLNLRWINKIRNSAKKNKSIDKPIFIKKELEAEEMLENAKIHRHANSPLKKIKEFDGLTKFCQCCYNPMKDNIHVTNFNFCDSPDEYAEFGTGIPLYFFYIKYSIIILFITFYSMVLPCLIISKNYTDEIVDICERIYSGDSDNINITFPFCNGFVKTDEEDNFYHSQIMALLIFNSMNIKQYREIFFNITNNNDNIDKVFYNFPFIYFIGLISLFIIHSLYTIILFNINKQYDMNVTSPSDYSIIVTNMQSAFKIFYHKVKEINDIITNKNKTKTKRRSFQNNLIEINEDTSARKIFKEFQEIGLDNLDGDNEINISEGFNEFVKSIICGNENGEKYNIHLINICYKINEFKLTKEKIKEKNSEIYIAKKDPEQLQKNMKLNLEESDYRYFYHPLDIFNLYICPFTVFEKSLKISDIEIEKQKLEDKLKQILIDTENLTEENFSGVVFVIFNSMKEKDNFLESQNKDLIMKIINSISNLKYYLCLCCINKDKRNEFLLRHNISIEVAPEPEDVIYENLEFSWVQRLFRTLFVYIISFILIAMCFFFILYLNSVQIKKSQNEKTNNIIYRYGVSASISLIIAVINAIFENILIILTKLEKQISMTNYFLSYSIKLTILTFFSSVMIPYLSSNYYKAQLNHDILITNCLTMFISNSFLIPITWTINFEFFLKKIRRCIIKRKNKRLPQDELNTLFELLDMDIASKYSYVTRTLFMCFFYLPIFPFGVPICFCGFIFSYFLEKFNFVKMYKKPVNLNSRIYEFYSNYFILNLFMASLGDYLFLKDVYNSNFWVFLNIILFSALVIVPYNNFLNIDLIGINESDIKEGELYEDYFYNFFNDYERNNPITKKDGIKHFLDKLLEKVLITKNDYDTILQNYEHMNLLEIYYKSKLHFGYNLLKRAFFSSRLSQLSKKKVEKRKSLDISKLNKSKFIKSLFNPINNNIDNKEKVNNEESEDTKEEQKKQNRINIVFNNNIYNNRNQNNYPSNNDLILNFKNSQIIKIKNRRKKLKENYNNNIEKKENKKLKLRKDLIKRDYPSKKKIIFSKKNTIEDEEEEEEKENPDNIMNEEDDN